MIFPQYHDRSMRTTLFSLFLERSNPRKHLAQGGPAGELGGKVQPGMRRARRGQRQIGKIGTAREMAVVEAPCTAAVEGDGADQRVRVEQVVDRVRSLP